MKELKTDAIIWLLVHLFLALFMFCIWYAIEDPTLRARFVSDTIKGLPVIAVIEFMVIGSMQLINRVAK